MHVPQSNAGRSVTDGLFMNKQDEDAIVLIPVVRKHTKMFSPVDGFIPPSFLEGLKAKFFHTLSCSDLLHSMDTEFFRI